MPKRQWESSEGKAYGTANSATKGDYDLVEGSSIDISNKNLSSMARDFLSLITPSVPVESFFLLSGNIMSRKRCNLFNETIKQPAFINS